MRTINLPSTRFDVSREAFVIALNEAVAEKFGTLDERHRNYLKRELKLIDNVPDQWLASMLIVSDFVRTMKKKHPYCISDGRGTMVASFAAYLLDITGIDPVLFDLQPERFYIGAKTSPIPDFSLDVAPSCKEDMILCLFDKYGEENIIRCLTELNKNGLKPMHACAFFITAEPYNGPGSNRVRADSDMIACILADMTAMELEAAGHMRINLISCNQQETLMKMQQESVKSFNFAAVDCKNVMLIHNLLGAYWDKTLVNVSSFDDAMLRVAIATTKHCLGSGLSRKSNRSKKSCGNEYIDTLLWDKVLYQEEIVEILHNVLDIDYMTACEVRKNIAKKNECTISLVFSDFVAVLTNKGLTPDIIIKAWNKLCYACGKATVKAHTVSVVYTATKYAYYNSLKQE